MGKTERRGLCPRGNRLWRFPLTRSLGCGLDLYIHLDGFRGRITPKFVPRTASQALERPNDPLDAQDWLTYPAGMEEEGVLLTCQHGIESSRRQVSKNDISLP